MFAREWTPETLILQTTSWNRALVDNPCLYFRISIRAPKEKSSKWDHGDPSTSSKSVSFWETPEVSLFASFYTNAYNEPLLWGFRRVPKSYKGSPECRPPQNLHGLAVLTLEEVQTQTLEDPAVTGKDQTLIETSCPLILKTSSALPLKLKLWQCLNLTLQGEHGSRAPSSAKLSRAKALKGKDASNNFRSDPDPTGFDDESSSLRSISSRWTQSQLDLRGHQSGIWPGHWIQWEKSPGQHQIQNPQSIRWIGKKHKKGNLGTCMVWKMSQNLTGFSLKLLLLPK